MTKQQTVELLKQQLPGFYSVEQVINLINGIDEPSKAATLSPIVLESLVEEAEGRLLKILDRADAEELVDYSSAEMQMDNNEVSLYFIDVNTEDIAERCINVLRETLMDFFLVAEEEEVTPA